jgi:hypothetical protein
VKTAGEEMPVALTSAFLSLFDQLYAMESALLGVYFKIDQPALWNEEEPPNEGGSSLSGGLDTDILDDLDETDN